MDIYGRELNPSFFVEITQCQKYVKFVEEGTPGGNLTRSKDTGQYFFSIFFVGVDPVHVIRDNKEEAEKEHENAKKMLKKYM